MNKELAEFVARVAFKNASELSKLIPILKNSSDQEQVGDLANAITKIAELISTDILFKIYDEHPVIHANFKKAIEIYGKLP